VDDQHPVAARWTFYIGPDGRILAIDPKINVRTAGEDVVKRLDELKIRKTR
jgi:hypothetical protein